MKKKMLIRISISTVALAVIFAFCIILSTNNICQPTVSQVIQNGSYSNLSMQPIRTMQNSLSSIETLAEVEYISSVDVTEYTDLVGNIIEEDELLVNESGKRLYQETNYSIWSVRIIDSICGVNMVGEIVDVIVPTIDVENFKSIDTSQSMIIGMTSDNGKYYTGLGQVYYIDDGKVYPAYDIEDFIKEYKGVKIDLFKKKMQKFFNK